MAGLVREQTKIDLIEATRCEVKKYAAYSPLATLYPLLDDIHNHYAVVIREHDSSDPMWVVVMAKVTENYIVILEDTTDKPLVDALMVNAGVPRDKIILAYAGETLPEK